MAETRDFLLEIGTEEMPSAPLMNASRQLGDLVARGLDAAGLAHGEVRVISSPRRLAALVSDVAVATDEVHEVRRGPKAAIAFDGSGQPTKAAAGFARKCGVDPSDLVRRVDADGSEYVFAERSIPSRDAVSILSLLRRCSCVVTFTAGCACFHDRNVKVKAAALAAILAGVVLLALAK